MIDLYVKAIGKFIFLVVAMVIVAVSFGIEIIDASFAKASTN